MDSKNENVPFSQQITDNIRAYIAQELFESWVERDGAAHALLTLFECQEIREAFYRYFGPELVQEQVEREADARVHGVNPYEHAYLYDLPHKGADIAQAWAHACASAPCGTYHA